MSSDNLIVEATGLTREHLKVLRNADDIVVRHHGERFQYAAEGEQLPRTFFDCIKKENPHDGFGDRERRVEVPVELAQLTIYTRESASQGLVANSNRIVGHALWHLYPRFSDDPAHTLVHEILKVGDRITPIWRCNNNTDHVRNAGLTVDQFLVEIRRGPVDEPRKCKRLTVLLDSMATDPNSSARNIIWAQS